MDWASFALFGLPAIIGLVAVSTLFFAIRRWVIILCILIALLCFSWLYYAANELS